MSKDSENRAELTVAGERATAFYDGLDLEAKHFLDESRFLHQAAIASARAFSLGDSGIIQSLESNDQNGSQNLIAYDPESESLTLRPVRFLLPSGAVFDLRQPLTTRNTGDVSRSCWLEVLESRNDEHRSRYWARLSWQTGESGQQKQEGDHALIGAIHIWTPGENSLPWIVTLHADAMTAKAAQKLAENFDELANDCRDRIDELEQSPPLSMTYYLLQDEISFRQLSFLLERPTCTIRQLAEVVLCFCKQSSVQWNWMLHRTTRWHFPAATLTDAQTQTLLTHYSAPPSDPTCASDVLAILRALLEGQRKLLGRLFNKGDAWEDEPPSNFGDFDLVTELGPESYSDYVLAPSTSRPFVLLVRLKSGAQLPASEPRLKCEFTALPLTVKSVTKNPELHKRSTTRGHPLEDWVETEEVEFDPGQDSGSYAIVVNAPDEIRAVIRSSFFVYQRRPRASK